MKKVKGMSLIVFTVILAVLVVVVGGIIVYLLNNPVKEKVAIQTPTSVQSNLANNEDVIENNKNIESTEKTTMSADERYSLYINGLKNNLRKLQNAVTSPDGEKI